MAGGFQESVTLTGTNGSTYEIVMNGSIVVPFRYVYLSQVTAIVTNGTTETIYVYQDSGNGTTNGTNAKVQTLVYENGTFSASYLNERGLWRFCATEGLHHDNEMKLHVALSANGTNGTNGTTISAVVTLGGFGLN